MNQTIKCVFVFLFAQTGMGRIIVGPKDVEAVVGTRLVLLCQTNMKDSSNPMQWYFKANDYEAYDAIYKRGLILNGNKGKMKVEVNVSSGHYDLVIFNVSINNAGAYTCLDDSSQQRAEIIVFEQYPSDEFCSLTKPSDIILGTNQCNMEPDQIEISCKLRYLGNFKPHLKWFNGEQLISSNISTTIGIITSTVVLRADKLHSPSFNCRVAYENNMASTFNWTATVSVTSALDLTTVTRTKCNQTRANCSTLANLTCNSAWMDDSNNVIANGSLLGLENLSTGNYTCIATCSIRKTPCSFVREQIVHTCDAKNKKMKNSEPISNHLLPVLVLCASVLLGVTVILTILLLKRRKKKEKSIGLHSAIGDGEQEASVLVAFPVSTGTDRETNGLQEQQNLLDA